MNSSKVGVFFRNVVMWLFFAVFLIIGLGSMFTSVLSGVVMLIAASFFVPQLNRLIESKTGYTITPGFRCVVVLICLGFFFYSTNSALDADRAQRSAQEVMDGEKKAERDMKAKHEYVIANKDAILAELRVLVAKQDFDGATALASKYNNAGSFEVDQELSRLSAKKAEVDKQQRKSKLLTSLGAIARDDFKGLAGAYSQIATIDPTYQVDADNYTRLAEQHAQEIKTREAAAALKERRKQMGQSWNYADGEDKMSGKSVRRAYVSSVNTVNFKFPYSGVQQAMLTIRKHPRWGTSVYLSLDKGQFVCGYDDCDIRVRFSKGSTQRMSASAPDDHSSNLLFINNTSTFIAQSRKADKVYMEADFFQEGSRVFEFDISDLEWK